MTLKDRLQAVFRERFGLQLDDVTSTRVEALAQRQAEAERLDLWLSALRDADPSSVPVRAAMSVATNGQTYFMRDRPQLSAVEAWLAARHRELRRPLHLWSAGCSTGEEAYSLSMLGIRLGVPLYITASDVNAEALERARRGIYAEWSLRHVLEPERNAHFVYTKEGFEVHPRVRQPITFALHNLATSRALVPDKPDRLWDAILCRNVLIYFEPQARARVLARLEAALPEEGALVLSSSESLRGIETRLRARQLAGAFLFVRGATEGAGSGLHTPVRARDREGSSPPSNPAPRVSTFPPRGGAPASVPPEAFPESVRPNVKPLLDAGNRLLREHSFFSALEQYSRAITLDGLSFEPYLLSAIVQLKQGALAEAKASLRSALFLEPQLWQAEYLLSGIYAREERRAEQLSSLARAEQLLLRLDPAPYFASDTAGIEPICYNREQALSVCRARLKSIRKGTP